MRRTVWFSLCCMIGLALLVSGRALAPFAAKTTSKTPDSFAVEEAPLAIKSDRLVVAAPASDKATVKTVKVAVPPSTDKQEAGLAVAQKSYASMRGRAHHHRHHKKRHRHRR